MSGPALRIERVAIHAVRGVPHGAGFSCDDLSPGITVLHGPNGIGKSTTALALVEILWPGASGLGRGTLAGRYRLDGATWDVDVDAGHATWRRDGTAHGPPDLPPSSAARCCHLALPDLLTTDDDDFAAVVLRASQGNFDLRAAIETLGLARTPPGASSAKTELEVRTTALREAEAAQRELLLRSEGLAALRERCAESERAAVRAARLTTALAAIDAADECTSLRARLDALPAAVGALTGHERARLTELDEEARSLTAQRDAERAALEAAESRRAACGLPADGVADDVLERGRALRSELEAIDDELAEAEREQRRAATGERTARDRLGDAMTDDQLAALDRVRVDGLEDLARRGEALRAEREVLRRRRHALADDGTAPPSAAVEEGMEALARWLAAPRAAPRRPIVVAVIALVLLAGAGVLGAVLHHVGWIVFTAVAAALAAWLAAGGRGRGGADAGRSVHIARFEQTGLEAPAAWTPDVVGARLAALGPEHAAAALAEERAALRRALGGDEAALAERERELERDLAGRSADLGVDLVPGDAWLVTLVATIADWQAMRDEDARRTAEVEHLGGRQATAIAAVGELVESRPSTSDEARRAVEHLLERAATWKRATDEIDAAARRLDAHVEPALRANATRRAGLFTALELDADDIAGLDELLEQRAAWTELEREHRDAVVIRDRLRTELGPDAALCARDRDELAIERTEFERQAGQRDELQREITAIETEVERTQRGHDLGDALAARDAAVDAVRAKRDDHERRRVALALVEHLREHTVARSRPAVFARASELLGHITRGRFTLELDDGEPPAFRARDTVSGQTRALDELSSGERVQVLLAVRLAFLEREEGGVRLPLLLDEVLATSDDDRARLVIDAATELARGGRQVITFSAQPDEVGKWTARLRERGLEEAVDLRIVDLAARRGREAAAPIVVAAPAAPPVPAPGSDDIETYRARLDVPPLHPRDSGAGGVHVAHLVDEPALLHLLLCERVPYFGQLERMVALGGGGFIDPAGAPWHRTARRAALVRQAFALWRRGRGRPVDRGALLDSGAVTDRFLEAVAGVASEVGGDARTLLTRVDALEGWGPKKSAKLREALTDIGCLDEDERLDAATLRLEVRGRATEIDAADAAWLDRLIANLPHVGTAPGGAEGRAAQAVELRPGDVDAPVS